MLVAIITSLIYCRERRWKDKRERRTEKERKTKRGRQREANTAV